MAKKIVKEALNAFFLEQDDSGLWGKRVVEIVFVMYFHQVSPLTSRLVKMQ